MMSMASRSRQERKEDATLTKLMIMIFRYQVKRVAEGVGSVSWTASGSGRLKALRRSDEGRRIERRGKCLAGRSKRRYGEV